MDDLKRYIKKKILRALLTPLKIARVKRNRVFLINQIGENYACNPKAIAEYLLEHYKNQFDIVYMVADVPKNAYLIEKGIRPVRNNSIKYFVYLLTSRVIVTNSGGISYVPLRKKQYVINTHHGGGAYKTAGIDMFGDTPFFRKDISLSAGQIDVFLSTNRRFTEVISKASLVPIDKFWEIGMPRNDRLINPSKTRIARIRSKLGLTDGQHLVLYAPTYRKPEDNYFKSSVAIAYDIDCKTVLRALHKRFGGEWVFAFRLHPRIENKQDYIIDGALDLSDYVDMQDLLEVSDVLINDFSSSFWDFMLTGRPCFMYAPDLDHYVATTKVYTPVDEWPFPKSRTSEELCKSILDFDEFSYKRDCEKHYMELGGCESGRATELVCGRILEVCAGD